jgi:CRP-like cAMP-binding protein
MTDPLMPAQLRSLTPLNALSEPQWRELRSQLVAQPLLAGQVLVNLGDQTPVSYFLLAGELVLRAEDGSESRLSAGTSASCYPLSPTLPRLHQVRALVDSSYLAVDSATLDRLLTWRFTYQDLLLEGVENGDSIDWIERLLDNPLFAKVPSSNVQAMLQRLQRLELPAGQAVLREGESGECCYFLHSGRAEVIRYQGESRQVLAELDIGACFGEEALLADSPRNATVTMLEDGVVLRLARPDFLDLLKAPVVKEVTLAEAARLLAAGAQWLDVRLQAEYEQAHALQALNMPLPLLRLKARLLDPTLTYICYCDSGKRSSAAVFLLSQLGFDAYSLQDGADRLPAIQRDGLLCERGAGYLARSGGRVERSA